jgi:RNA-directed DNA polymerase
LPTEEKRQNNQLKLAFMAESRSEPLRSVREGTERLMKDRGTESPAITEQLMEEVVDRENCKTALKQVKANKGGPGIDGRTVDELPEYLSLQAFEIAGATGPCSQIG